MKTLLLGPNGQLGTDLTLAAGRRSGGVELIPVGRDVLDVERIDQIATTLSGMEFQAVINCTSYHKTDEVESNAQRAVTVNAHAVRVIAEACAARRARLVHVSSDYVFDGRADKPYTEEAIPGPLNVYGATKLMGESLARAAHNDVLVLRVASLFGVAGASGKGGNFVETMIRFGREKGQLRVVADQIMSPTATADVAEMILTALESRLAPGVYHAVNTGRASWFEFAQRIIKRAGVNAAVEPIPASAYPVPARRPAFSALDNGKLAGQIGPIPHWHDALDRYLLAKGHIQAVPV